MLLAIDATFGEAAPMLVAILEHRFAPALHPFAAPREAPDAGLVAALQTAPLAILQPTDASPWLAEVVATHLVLDLGDDPVALVRDALGVMPRAPQSKKPVRLPPLDVEALAFGLEQLGDAWGIEIDEGNGLGGLCVWLVASFRSDGYAEAADFAHAVAVLAEQQNHHPTLIHDWRTVTVKVATGEAGQRLTERDLRFAAAVDRLAAGSP
ncbi:MAG: 4a-hydroxytetrahydrobiopterin dehydratase [Pseudomonadota bacterium]